MSVELIADYQCVVGEGVIWHPTERCVYWLDILTGRAFRYDPASGKHEQIYHGDQVGGITIQVDGSLLLFGARGSVRRWHDGALTTIINEIVADRDSRFNDVIADPAGRVYCGTMAGSDHPGRLYRLETDGRLTTVVDDVAVPNGLGFTPDRRGLYFTDTMRRTIFLYDYDYATGALTNRRTFAAVAEDAAEGLPDGMTVARDGSVWSARWDGSVLVHYSPAGAVVAKHALPAKKVASAAFGGDDYSDLYVITAGGDKKETDGQGAGALYRFRPGVKGVPEFSSRVAL